MKCKRCGHKSNHFPEIGRELTEKTLNTTFLCPVCDYEFTFFERRHIIGV